MGTALYQQFPWWYSVLMLLSFVGNITVLLVSQLGDSAIIKSSICVGDGCPELVLIDLNYTNACNNSNDVAIFSEGSNSPVWTNNEEELRLVGINCFLSQGSDVFESCKQTFINSNITDDPNTGAFEQFTEECVECFIQNILCTSQNCATSCSGSLSGNPATPECIDCTISNCLPSFETCSGVTTPEFDPFSANRTEPIGEQITDYVCTARLDNFIEMYEVYTIKFLESIAEAWNGGVQFLAIFVAVASGIWPHTKNILMAIAWFMPFSHESRDKILYLLAYLGKWSLVDVFFVVLILVGVRLDKYLGLSAESAVIVIAESRLAIYLFGTAAIWALLQGEFIRYLSRKVEDANDSKNQIYVSETMTAAKYRTRQYIVALFALLALVFGVVGTLLVNIRFELFGILDENPGPNIYEYTSIEVATQLFDNCVLDCSELLGKCGHGSIPGSFYLAIMFAVMGVFLPILTYGVGFIAALVPPDHPKWRVAHQLFKSMSYFSAMDVYFFSQLVLISQFAGLINASLGEDIAEECGVDPGETCIGLRGSLELGTWLTLCAVVFFWLTQYGIATLLARRPANLEISTKT